MTPDELALDLLKKELSLLLVKANTLADRIIELSEQPKRTHYGGKTDKLEQGHRKEGVGLR